MSNCSNVTRTKPDPANELACLRERAEKDYRQDEEKLASELTVELASLVDYLEKNNNVGFGSEGNKKSLNINISLIRDKHEAIISTIKNFLGDYIGSQMVLTNPECNEICNEPDKSKREKNFKAFYKRLDGEAREALAKKIGDLLAEQKRVIREAIEKRSNEAIADMQNSEALLQQILSEKQTKAPVLVKRKIDFMYQKALCDIVLDTLEK